MEMRTENSKLQILAEPKIHSMALINLGSASFICQLSSSSSTSTTTPQFLIPKHKKQLFNRIYSFSSSKTFAQSSESTESGVTEQDPPSFSGSLSSTRTQLDLLEQLRTTSSTSADEYGYQSDGSSRRLTIRDQLAQLVGDSDDNLSIPLGKNLKKVSAKFLTLSQKRNIRRQAYLDEVSQRNDSVFFATIGAFVILPPIIILGIAVLNGYVQLFP